MSSNNVDLMVGNRPLSSLRVVDLKQELEKRGLSKSGSKKDLADRLRLHLQIEKHRGEGASADEEELPNYSVHEDLAEQNPFIRDYLASQAELFHSQKVVKKLVEEEAKRESETSADESVDSPVKQKPPTKTVVETKEQSKTTSSSTGDTPEKQTLSHAIENTSSVPVPETRRNSRRKTESTGEEMTAEKLLTRSSRSSRSRSPAAATAATASTETIVQNNNVQNSKQETVPDALIPPEKPPEDKVQESIAVDPSPAQSADDSDKKSPEPESTVNDSLPSEPEITKKETTVEKNQNISDSIKNSEEIPKRETSSPIPMESKSSETTPVAEVEAKPVAEVKVKPVVEVEAKPVAEIEAKPTAEVKTKPVADVKAKPVAEVEAKPAAEVKVKPVVEVEAKPVAEIEAKPTAEVKTKPVADVKAKPVAEVEAKPAAEVKAKPVAEAEAKPVAEIDNDEIQNNKASTPQEKKDNEISPQIKQVVNKEKQRSRSCSPIQPKESPALKGDVSHDKEKEDLPKEEKEDDSASSGEESSPRSEARSRSSRSRSRSGSRSKSRSRSRSKSRSRSRSANSRGDTAVDKRSDPCEENDEDAVELSINASRRSLLRSPERSKSPEVKKAVASKDEDRNGQPRISDGPSQVGEKMDVSSSSPSPRYKGSQKSQKETYTKFDLAGEEALDYGEEEDDEDKNENDLQEFSWTRRTLRFKNKQGFTAPVCKWELEEESKHLLIKSDLLNKYYQDIKLVPLEQLKLEDKSVALPETKNDIGRTPSISLETETEEPLPTRTVENVPTIKRTISIVSTGKTNSEQPEENDKSLTPPRNPPSNVLLITNLVRPFTLPQLKEMLQRTGNLHDIWVDKIKSKCIAKFDSQEEAFETRAALHGVCWPSSNPKSLHVDYTHQDNLDEHKAKEGGEQSVVAEKPVSAQPLPVREWDVGKKPEPKSPNRNRKRSRSRSNSRDRNKRSRQTSPGRRRHSRSPEHERRNRGGEGKEPEPMGKALDELFRKTVATPSIYWLPLTPEQIAEKEELRRKRMLERERRIAELSKMRPR